MQSKWYMKLRPVRQLLARLVVTMPGQAGATLLLLLLTGLMQGIGLLMLIPLLQLVGIDTGYGAANQFVNFTETVFAALQIPLSLGAVLLLYIFVMGTSAFLSRWSTLSAAKLQIGFAVYIKERLFDAITRSKWLFFSRKRSSDLTHIITEEVLRMVAATDTLLRMTATFIMATVYVSLSFLLSPVLTTLIFVVGVMLFLVFRQFNYLAHALGKQWQGVQQEIYAVLSESFAGMKVVKSHGLAGSQTTFFSSLLARFATVSLASSKVRADLSFWLSLSSVLILGLFVYLAIMFFQVSATSLLMLLYLFSRLIPTFSGLQAQYQSLNNMLVAFESIVELLAQSEAALEHPGSEAMLEFSQEIRLENVSFSYEEFAGYPALSNLSLSIRAGETAAIVGPSGSGKSTLADLLIGLITPSKGRVLIDGRSLSPEYLQSWREHIGYVPQEAFMFHDTVRANLLLVRPQASDEEIMEALEFASADDFVSKLPEGLGTILGDRGVRLSGGERQRLALARAILRRPTLLVLDEATSSLDTENERRIQEAIEKLGGKMTILVIAHRLSTVRNADIIYVLERGRLVESGDWYSLVMKEGGRFQALYKEQGLVWDNAQGLAR